MIAIIAARLSTANATHAYSRRVPDSIHASAGGGTCPCAAQAARGSTCTARAARSMLRGSGRCAARPSPGGVYPRSLGQTPGTWFLRSDVVVQVEDVVRVVAALDLDEAVVVGAV